MSKNAKLKRSGLTAKHWFGYMFGDFGGCMTFALMGSIFTIYCTDCLGVNTGILGTLVIIWTIWDAVNDPMMGALMTRLSPSIKIRTASSAPGCYAQHLCSP